jgi:hypothetical protein
MCYYGRLVLFPDTFLKNMQMKNKPTYVEQPLFDTAPFLSNEFATRSPINEEKITGQNKTVFDYLAKEGRTLTAMSAFLKFRITRLGARVWDLKKIHNVTIFDRMIKENGVDVKEYSRFPLKKKENAT